MGLLDENFEPEMDFGVFFEILDVSICHGELFRTTIGGTKEPSIREALGNVRVEIDSKGRIRPVKEDIIKIIYDHITDKNIVQFMMTKNKPRVSFASCTADVSDYWNHDSKYVPKLHINVRTPRPMLEKANDGWTMFNYKDILTITLIDRRLLSDPEWLEEVERRKIKSKKF